MVSLEALGAVALAPGEDREGKTDQAKPWGDEPGDSLVDLRTSLKFLTPLGRCLRRFPLSETDTSKLFEAGEPLEFPHTWRDRCE